ncbi:MAG: hypothetical protein HYV07_27640 [Deltaproteobacteria bacterium]|nr:hypothetical protein [Deltaproteobacteria bacterium]
MRWPKLLALLASGCSLTDFEDGAPCNTRDDCVDYECLAGRCRAPDSIGDPNEPEELLPGVALRFESVSVSSDTNRDGELSPGESGGLSISIRNAGSAQARGVVGILSTTREGVTIGSSNLYFGSVSGGSTSCGSTSSSGSGYCSPAPTISIDESVAAGTSLPFTLELRDSLGSTFSLDFSYVTPAINQTFVLESVSVSSDTNRDGNLSPGETGALAITIRNSGAAQARGVTGVLSTTQPGVTIANANLYFGHVSGGSTSCGSTSSSGAGYCSPAPSVSVDTSIAAGTAIQFSLGLTDEYGSEFSVSFRYTTPAINQSFVAESVSVSSDTNRDGHLSPGETGTLAITIRNSGSAQARGVTGVLSTTQPGVTIGTASLFFGNVSGGSTSCGSTSSSGAGYCSPAPTVTVDASVSAGTSIPFALDLTDEHGSRFELSFRYTTPAINQSFVIESVSVTQDTNRDGSLSPGESGSLQITLRNNGSAQARGVTGLLSTTQAGVTIASSTVYFGHISGGSTSCGSTSSSGAGYCSPAPSVSIGAGVASGTPVRFSVALTDAYGNTASLSFDVTVR